MSINSCVRQLSSWKLSRNCHSKALKMTFDKEPQQIQRNILQKMSFGVSFIVVVMRFIHYISISSLMNLWQPNKYTLTQMELSKLLIHCLFTVLKIIFHWWMKKLNLKIYDIFLLNWKILLTITTFTSTKERNQMFIFWGWSYFKYQTFRLWNILIRKLKDFILKLFKMS